MLSMIFVLERVLGWLGGARQKLHFAVLLFILLIFNGGWGPVWTDKPSEHCFHRDGQRNSISVCLSSQNIVKIDRPNNIEGVVSDSDVVMPEGHYSWHSSFDKSGENRDIYLGLESLDDFLPHATADMETNVEDSILSSEAASVDAPSTKNARLSIPVHSSIDASTCPQQSAVQDPLTVGEPIISSSYGGDHMDDISVETEEMDAMDTQVLSELTTRSGRRSGKFLPKPKIQMQNKIHEASITNADGLESALCLQDSQSVPSEIDFGDKCSIPAFPPDDVLDLSAVGFTHANPTESMPELLVNQDPIDLMETSRLDSGFPGDHPEVVPELPAELHHARNRKCKTRASVPSPEQQNASTSGQENEAGRSLRPRKNIRNVFQLVDEFDDEVHGDGEFPAECPSSLVIGEDNIADKEIQVENESQTKKVKKNSMKPIGDKEKPAGKRKKAKEASDQAAKSKPKKFSHSTLKQRQVDTVLLETPEDEIDFQKVPLRDLILLAEHKELLKKKEATTGGPSTNQSNGNQHYNEDEAIASDQDGEYDRGQASPRVEESNIYFNYQTYMDRTPRIRWSKQDTELFYEV
ncbi:transcription factor TFIIIB component B''-like [Abeliophyllum distichum]|uniref:Transcription factor TFIIIB component B''-like n=1 Tax=Abeliophyllum distichum TaxID=126358 RepID=A0ABD1SB46_9LAMI